jgi:hypothetical protein
VTYGARGYGVRAYGDSSLGGATLAGGGGVHTETLAAPATLTLTAQTPTLRIGHRIIPAAATLTLTGQQPHVTRIAHPLPASILLTPQTPAVLVQPAGGVSGGYETWAVNKYGARYGNVKAQVDEIEWVLNEAGTATFQYGTLTANGQVIKALEREVQIWRHGRLLWWGIPVRPDANAKRVQWRARELMWAFDHRYFGRADRDNYLDNPQFENGLTSWIVNNTTPTITASNKVLGANAVQLEQITAQQDAYIEQALAVTGTGVGTLWTLVGWYFIDPVTWEGEAIGARGLTLTRQDLGGVIQESGVYEISGATVRGLWQRAEVTVWTPPDVTEYLLIRCYSPAVHIVWDALSLTIMESIGTVSSGYPNYDWTSDEAEMIGRIVQHAQDPAYNKSDMNLGINCPVVGRRIARAYQFAEHGNIGDALREYPKEGGPDMWVETTPTTRTFRTAARRGTYRPEARRYLVYSASRGRGVGNMAEDFSWAFDGEQAVSSSTILGTGDGPDREEGGSVDPALFGGFTMEKVEQAPPDASIDSLDRLASEMVVTLSNPELLTVSFKQPDLIGVLMPGDTFPVLIDYGFVQVEAIYRVVRLRLNCRTEVFTATLNREP